MAVNRERKRLQAIELDIGACTGAVIQPMDSELIRGQQISKAAATAFRTDVESQSDAASKTTPESMPTKTPSG